MMKVNNESPLLSAKSKNYGTVPLSSSDLEKVHAIGAVYSSHKTYFDPKCIQEAASTLKDKAHEVGAQTQKATRSASRKMLPHVLMATKLALDSVAVMNGHHPEMFNKK